MERAELGKRLAVLVVTAGVIVALAGVGSLVAQSDAPADPPTHSEYEASTLVGQQFEAQGSVSADASLGNGEGVVLIDIEHRNRIDQSSYAALVEALVDVGYTVRFYSGGDLASQLEQSDAFVVMDPASEFEQNELDATKRFADEGGRVLILAEPNRISVSSGLFSTSTTEQESEVTALAAQFGMTVETRYLYNQETNDGNYKHVIARPTGEVDVGNLETMAMYTAASVSAKDGQAILQTTPETRLSGDTATSGAFTVAARKGNVVIVGDTGFLEMGRHNVADNERFVAYLVEFLIGGDFETGTTPIADGDDEPPEATTTENATSNAST